VLKEESNELLHYSITL